MRIDEGTYRLNFRCILMYMDRSLKEYEAFISTEIQKGHSDTLYEYHLKRVQEFQHERLIHLIVTLFFAGVLIATIIGFIMLSLVANSWVLAFPVFLIIVILFVIEVFYIRHYYTLENGTQRLYGYTKKFYELRTKREK